MRTILFCIIIFLFIPFMSEADETSAFYGAPPESEIQPQYESCKEMDSSSLDLEKFIPTGEDTEAEFCFLCPGKKTEKVRETALAVQSKAFMERLKNRVIGQIESKIFQTKVLRACATGDRNRLSRQKADWSFMEAICKARNKELQSSIKSRWKKMRVNLALSKVNPKQIHTGKLDAPFPLSHAVSGFSSMPDLTEEEKKSVKKRWTERLSKTSLDRSTSGEFTDPVLKMSLQVQRSTIKDHRERRRAALKNLEKTKKAYLKMKEEAKDAYFETVSEMPLLAYFETGNPNEEELGEAFTKMEGELENFLEEVKNPDTDEGLLLSFKPLVEELLSENKDYCLVAEKARIKAERKESLKNRMMLGAGVLAAVPCFITGVVGASACLTAGMALGVAGYKEARKATRQSLGRVLTGEQFETIASLKEKRKEEFLAKLFLPLGAMGVTAPATKVLARGAPTVFKKDTKTVKAAGFSEEEIRSRNGIVGTKPNASSSRATSPPQRQRQDDLFYQQQPQQQQQTKRKNPGTSPKTNKKKEGAPPVRDLYSFAKGRLQHNPNAELGETLPEYQAWFIGLSDDIRAKLNTIEDEIIEKIKNNQIIKDHFDNVGGGIFEFRDQQKSRHGSYRVYFAQDQGKIIFLYGGKKDKINQQSKDVKTAKDVWKNYRKNLLEQRTEAELGEQSQGYNAWVKNLSPEHATKIKGFTNTIIKRIREGKTKTEEFEYVGDGVFAFGDASKQQDTFVIYFGQDQDKIIPLFGGQRNKYKIQPDTGQAKKAWKKHQQRKKTDIDQAKKDWKKHKSQDNPPASSNTGLITKLSFVLIRSNRLFPVAYKAEKNIKCR